MILAMCGKSYLKIGTGKDVHWSDVKEKEKADCHSICMHYFIYCAHMVFDSEKIFGTSEDDSLFKWRKWNSFKNHGGK